MTESGTMDTLPRWDMTVMFPSVESLEFGEGFGEMLAALDGLGRVFDELGVRHPRDEGARDATPEALEQALAALNDALTRFHEMAAYLGALTAADSRDTAAESRQSELMTALVDLQGLGTRWTAWIGPQDVEGLITASAAASDHAFMLRREAELARRQMSPDEESLALELNACGATAWARLWDAISSQIEVDVEVEAGSGGTRMPVSEAANLMLSPDRALRERAYHATQDGWERWATPIAAAMNGIKGTGNALGSRRGWDDQLEIACFQNHIDREILEVMIAVTRETFPAFRRYLRAKARLIGVERLAWFDLFAPVGDPGRSWEWLDMLGLLESEFSAFSPNLGALMARAAGERWIDAGPRVGKQGGAFCNLLRGDESRILMNFTPSYDSVTTLAHEMGHAYHNYCQAGLEPLRRGSPSTLAETASTFCETLVYDSLLARADGSERLFMLEQSLQGATQIAVDIISRYDFERAVFRDRKARDLTIPEFCALMTEAQLGTYGDGLDPDRLHRWAWASKGHYYSHEEPFYNFPYLFGQLFGLGLYAVYQREPDEFVPRYERLLRSTGMSDAAGLAAEFGIDLRDAAFWRASLATIVRNIDLFEEMATGAPA